MRIQENHKNYIQSLYGLRAISIIMVVLFHFRASHFFDFQSRAARQLGLIFINGELGVNIFFVISGYLITLLLINEREQTGDISLKRFYIKRIFRIFPAYYALLLVYFALQGVHYFSISKGTWWSLLFYTKQFSPTGIHEIGHVWSLCVEEAFYLIYPLLFVLFYKRIRIVICVLIPCFVVFRFQSFHLPASEYKNTIFATGDSLLMGCLFAFENQKIQAFIKKYKSVSLLVFPLLFVSVSSFLFISSLFMHSSDASLMRMSFLPKLVYASAGNVGIITNLLIAYIILMSVHLRNLWFRFLNTSLLTYIGLLSYSIYLWQQLFTADKPYLHQMNLWLIVLIILAVAYLSYHLIERPFIKLREKWLTKKEAGHPIQAGVAV